MSTSAPASSGSGQRARVQHEARLAGGVAPVAGGRQEREREQRAGVQQRHVRVRRSAVVGRDPLADLDVRARRLQERAEVGGDALLVEVRVAVAQRAHAVLPAQLGVGRVVLGVREVQRHPHHRGLQHVPGVDRPLEVGLREAAPGARRARCAARAGAGPAAASAAGSPRRARARALDQELARGQRRRELLAREDPHRPQRRLKRMALAFTLPDTDGTPTPLHVDGAPAAVVVFTCNHCPYALAWHERIQDVARDYADRGVRVLQINANDAVKYPRDSLEAMKARVDAGEFASPVPARRDAGGRPRLGRQDHARRLRHRRLGHRLPRRAGRRPRRPVAERASGCAPRWTTCWPAARSPTPRRSRSAARSSGSRAPLLGRLPVAPGGAGGPARRARRGRPDRGARDRVRGAGGRRGLPGLADDPRRREDLFPIDDPPGLNCRVYRLADGRFSPTPDPESCASGALASGDVYSTLSANSTAETAVARFRLETPGCIGSASAQVGPGEQLVGEAVALGAERQDRALRHAAAPQGLAVGVERDQRPVAGPDHARAGDREREVQPGGAAQRVGVPRIGGPGA